MVYSGNAVFGKHQQYSCAIDTTLLSMACDIYRARPGLQYMYICCAIFLQCGHPSLVCGMNMVHLIALVNTSRKVFNRSGTLVAFSACTRFYDVIVSPMASQITSLTIVYSTVYSDADQRKHQSSASLALVRGIHRWPVNSPHKWPVTRKMFPFWWRHHEWKCLHFAEIFVTGCSGSCNFWQLTVQPAMRIS